MPGISRRDYEMSAAARERAMGRIHDTLAQRNQQQFQAGMQQRQADLSLRNQTVLMQQREEQRIREEKRQLEEIQRQRAEWSFGDKSLDFLIKAGDYPRINEKMAQDPQLANEFSTIMKDDTLTWDQKVRAIYAAEAAASQRIAIAQQKETPQQMMKKNSFVMDMSEFGGVGKKLIMPNGKGGFITSDVPESGAFGDLPSDSAQQMRLPEGQAGPPLPDFSQPPPPGYNGPPPTLRPWKPEMKHKRTMEIFDGYKGAISKSDAEILAQFDQYEASGVHPSWNPDFERRYAIASQHEEEYAAAMRKKAAGTEKKPDEGYYEKPTTFEAIRKEIVKELEGKSKEERGVLVEKGFFSDTYRDYTSKEIDQMASDRMREREQAFSEGRPNVTTPGPTPTATPSARTSSPVDAAVTRNNELKAQGVSAAEREKILRSEGLID